VKTLLLKLVGVVSLCNQVHRHDILTSDALSKLFRANLDKSLDHKIVCKDQIDKPLTKAGVANLKRICEQVVEYWPKVVLLDTLDIDFGSHLTEAVSWREHTIKILASSS
jgi:hypothetical protein